MPLRTISRFTGKLSRADENEKRQRISALYQSTGSGWDTTAHGIVKRRDPAGVTGITIPVRLNSRNMLLGRFGWEEMKWSEANSFWQVKSGGRTNASDGLAYEINNRDVIPLGDTHIVMLRTSQHIMVSGEPVLEFEARLNWIYFLLAGGVEISSNNRWQYTGSEMIRTGATTWAAPSVWTALSVTVDILNSVEHANTDSGIEGHGVDVDGADYPDNFDPQPIHRGTPIVQLHEDVVYTDSVQRYYTITLMNADDGICDPP